MFRRLYCTSSWGIMEISGSEERAIDESTNEKIQLFHQGNRVTVLTLTRYGAAYL